MSKSQTVKVTDDTEYHYHIAVDGTIHIDRCVSDAAQLVIPSAIDGQPVSSLGAHSFSRLLRLSEVVVPHTVRTIEQQAFELCPQLEQVEFDDGLEALDDDVFAFCHSLKHIFVPATVRKLGSNVASIRSPFSKNRQAAIEIDPGNRTYFQDALHVIYERRGDGLHVINGRACDNARLVLHPETVSIETDAFASNASIREAIFPEGLQSIGRYAFAGCASLARVHMCSTLKHLGTGAFSKTAVKSLELPASLETIDPRALETGPAIEGISNYAITSTLERVEIDPENPRYYTRGGLLFKRGASGETDTAVICANSAVEVDLSAPGVRIAPHAFDGTASIGHLTIAESAQLPAGEELLPHGKCSMLTIVFEHPHHGLKDLALLVGKEMEKRDFLAEVLRGPAINAEKTALLYDDLLETIKDPYERSAAMVHRLATRALLSAQHSRSFTEWIENMLPSICIRWSQQGNLAGFDQLADAGILNAGSLPRAISWLTEAGDTPGAAYLLQLQHRRFAETGWDLDL